MILLTLIDYNASFNSMISSVAKHRGWVVRPNKTPIAVKLASGTVVHSLGIAIGLASSGVWQACVTFLVLDLPFEVILAML